jgi:hypothetical protein
MSNANSVADVILQQNNGSPITLKSTTSLHQSFQLSGSAAVLTIPNPMVCIDSQVLFPSRSASAISFIVRAAGLGGGGGEPWQIDICQGTGLTPVIATTGKITGVADNWLLEAVCMWDPTSLYLRGIYYGWAGASSIGQNALTQVSQPANLAALQFNVAVTIFNGNPNAAFSLTDFSADME